MKRIELNFRRAKASDLDRILEIERSWNTTPQWRQAQFEQELFSPHSRFSIAETTGSQRLLAAYGVCWLFSPQAQILNLAVHPRWTRQGIGQWFLKLILDALRREEREILQVALEVHATNEAAISLYRKAGFQIVGRRPRFYHGREDALLMNCELQPNAKF